MAARRAERMVNLVLALLSTRQYLTAEQIRRAVPGYEADDGTSRADEAFKRMFERDKAELRELGVPLETGRTSAFDSDDGYRIARGQYELPPIEFDPAEATAVGLAARLWQSATLGEAARSALRKLRAGGVDVDITGNPGAVPHVDASEPSLPALLESVRLGRSVRFHYRKAGADAPQARAVEPWGVLSWRGRWYLVGHDRDRGEARSFRLSRIDGAVTAAGEPGTVQRPENIDLLAHVRNRSPESNREARIRVTGAGAGALRRISHRMDGDDMILGFTDVDWLADLIASAGPNAVALEPPALVAAVVARLSVAAGIDWRMDGADS
ncbi:MAG: helix-turn-helix transcriptional regulator [Jatrophihabitans sp.]